MSSDIMVDRISVLPQNVVDSILTRLEIKEAARTCILSQSWRFQWHFLSKININWQDFYEVAKVEFVKIIDHILLFHRGSVDKLELVIDVDTHNDIDRWILYVSRNGIKKLLIENCFYEYYNIPSCIFSCSDLTCLELTSCMVKPPTAFKEFGNLTKLTFCDVIIDSKVLENVINSCPLLSQLILKNLKPPPSLKINAPKLVMLHIHGYYHFPRLMSTPLLDSAYFELECREASANEDCKIVQLLGSMPILRRLEFERKALQHLAVGDVPACLPSVCPIKHLTVSINCEDLQDLLVAFCIFRSSPFLQHLEIGVSSNEDEPRISSDGFWKGEHDFGFKFDHLQTVKVNGLTGSESELMFIEFLLSKAPALKTMDIHSAYKPTIVEEIIAFPRISPNAQLNWPPIWNQ